MSKRSELKLEEVKALEDLERSLGKPIPSIDKIGHFSVGVRVDDKKIVALGVYNCDLKELPGSVGNLQSLQAVYLAENNLTTLPESFSSLTDLKELWLFNNQLQLLPESFGNLKKLKILNLSGNKLISLPSSFGNLESVEELFLYNNQLTSFPESFGNLHSLKVLWLHHNQLSKLPESFGKLRSLQELIVEDNDLEYLPESFRDLTALERLNLIDNKLEKIPGPLWRLPLKHLFMDRNPWEDPISKKYIEEHRDLKTIMEYCRQIDTLHLFISHDSDDEKLYRIREIEHYLEKQKEVSQAWVWEEWTGSISKFIDEKISESQLVLFIATQNSINSKPCMYELSLALQNGIHIIPIKGTDLEWEDLKRLDLTQAGMGFVDLSLEKGIAYTPDQFDQFCKTLYDYIEQYKRNKNVFDLQKSSFEEHKKTLSREIYNLLDSDEYKEIIKDNWEKLEQIFTAFKNNQISAIHYILKWADFLSKKESKNDM